MQAFVFVLIALLSETNGDDKFAKNDENGYFYNPDDYAEIVRPCQIYDLNCIRLFFAEHGLCTIKYGPLPDTIYRSAYAIHFPSINTSVIQTDVAVTGFQNSRIEEFYINKQTGNLVFALEGRNIALLINNGYVKFYRRGREPIVGEDFITITYSSITFTTIIPNYKNLRLEDAEVTEYIEHARPPFFIGPNALRDPDPQVIAYTAGLIIDLPTQVRDAGLTELTPFPIFYIQRNICDFGLKIVT